MQGLGTRLTILCQQLCLCYSLGFHLYGTWSGIAIGGAWQNWLKCDQQASQAWRLPIAPTMNGTYTHHIIPLPIPIPCTLLCMFGHIPPPPLSRLNGQQSTLCDDLPPPFGVNVVVYSSGPFQNTVLISSLQLQSLLWRLSHVLRSGAGEGVCPKGQRLWGRTGYQDLSSTEA